MSADQPLTLAPQREDRVVLDRLVAFLKEPPLLLTPLLVGVLAIWLLGEQSARGSAEHSTAVQFLHDGGQEYSGVATLPGGTVVFGATVVRNTSSRLVHLTSADLVGDVPSAAADVVGVRVLDPQANGGALVGAGPWPFRDYSERSTELAGYALPPGADAEVLYVVAVRKSGDYVWPRSVVRFRDGSRSGTATSPAGFFTCTRAIDTCGPRAEPAP